MPAHLHLASRTDRWLCPAEPAWLPEFLLSQQQLALQYVAIGLPQEGTLPGFCLAAEYSSACNPSMDGSVCAWQNVRRSY